VNDGTGLFGGAFDPPHLGHVSLLEGAARQFALEAIVVFVVANPGHKGVHAGAGERLSLARAAFPGYDVRLDGHARTVDLLRESRYRDPLFLIGADEFADLPTWKEPEAVLELARLGVATRPGYPQERLEAVLAQVQRPDRVLFFQIEPVEISSSDVRERVARGESIDGLVPLAVAQEIAGSHLYRG
jgi:nicotinate-nucleotide adenylyltransferase